MEFPGAGNIPAAPPLLARQGSIYSLTFDEFQSTLAGTGAKDFGSMNMDELLRSIWTAEESNAVAASAAAAPVTTAAAEAPAVLRQGSLTLPRTISQKTVDEVWREIIGFGSDANVDAAAAAAMAAPEPVEERRRPTLGEMTLEEFLVKAGVVREDARPPSPPPPTGIVPVVLTLGNENGISMPTTLATPLPMAPASPFGTAGVAKAGISNAFLPAAIAGPTAAIAGPTAKPPVAAPAPYAFASGTRGRRTSAVERVAERRQRRMIKNRESAARSRARKQAYITELEAEVEKLKEQNAQLQRNQAEMMKAQKKEIQECISQRLVPKRLCLRRAITGPW